jgi:hypothetical protein
MVYDEIRTQTAIARKQAGSTTTPSNSRYEPLSYSYGERNRLIMYLGAIEDKPMAAHDAFTEVVFNEIYEYIKESINKFMRIYTLKGT